MNIATPPACGIRRSLLAVVAVLASTVVLQSSAGADHPLPNTSSPSWQTNDRVRAVVAVGDRLYFGGRFTRVRPPGTAKGSAQEVVRNRAAAVSASDGSLLSWNPNLDGQVWAMAASPDGETIYLGGDFKVVDGKSRVRFAAVDAVTGEPRAWSRNVPARVRTIEPAPGGGVVYIGGQFRKVAGKVRTFVAAINPSNGALTDWGPTIGQVDGSCPPRCTPMVTALALSADGDTLYVGGHFGHVNGVGRNNAGAVDVDTGNTTRAWNPDVFKQNPDNPNQKNFVYGIAVSPSTSDHADRVFICGDFWAVGGVRSPNLAAVHKVTGVRDTNWVATTDGGTPACVVKNGRLYVGGHFLKVGGEHAKFTGVKRLHLAAISATSGAVDSWNGIANSKLGVHALAARAGDVLLVGGDFTRIGRRDQQGFGMFKGTL